MLEEEGYWRDGVGGGTFWILMTCDTLFLGCIPDDIPFILIVLFGVVNPDFSV